MAKKQTGKPKGSKKVWRIKVRKEIIEVVSYSRDKARYEAYLIIKAGRKKPYPFVDFLHGLVYTKQIG